VREKSKKRLINFLIASPLLLLFLFLLSIPLLIFGGLVFVRISNYYAVYFAVQNGGETLNKDVALFMQKQFGITQYTIKGSEIDDFLFDPSGSWWLELPEGFDIQKLRQNKKFWVNSDLYQDERISSEQITSQVQHNYKITVYGFEAFFAEDQDLGMNICTASSGCNLVIYARGGDKNFFVYFSTM
jgi:hypothetical protein